jgi:MFS transporter, ACS family, hexuronate transporter
VSETLGRFRWAALAVFALSTVINFLDRATLAQLAIPVRQEFHLTNAQYGLIQTAFYIPYALMAPLAGMWIDRVGLSVGASLAIGLWSAAGIATGFSRGLGGLAASRAVLGFAEAGGIPAAAKAIHIYLRPAERSVGNACNQIAVSLGLILAVPLATGLAMRHGWRSAFLVTGTLGLAWIPLWLWTSRRAPPSPSTPAAALTQGQLLRDGRLWIFVAANALSMIGYSFWGGWTANYLMTVHKLTLPEAARYTWIPPAATMVCAFAGGWLSMRLVQRGVAPAEARYRICLLTAWLSLLTAALPWAPDAAWSSAGIALSFGAVAAFSVNMYTIPLDIFGRDRAAFAISFLTASAGGIAAVIMYPIGAVVDRYGYTPVTFTAALAPLTACALLRASGSLSR